LKLVLDTNVYCDFGEGLPDVVDTVATCGEFIFIPSIHFQAVEQIESIILKW
jgi:hypothetical protein